MKTKLLQIHWHETHPVYSLSCHPSNRLATAGGDCAVRIWCLATSNQTVSVQFLATLKRHSRAVNVVAFHPIELLLASAGDGGTMILWKLDPESDPGSDQLEKWTPITTYSIVGDIYDLTWSPDGKYLLFGSTTNMAVIWDHTTNTCIKILKDHKHFVQGVAWDPLEQFIATQSSDRTVRIYQYKTRKTRFITRSLQTLAKAMFDQGIQKRLFHDETLHSFFRRLAFSPDGSLLLVPAAIFNNQHCAYIYTRASLLQSKTIPCPVAFFGPFDSPVIVIKPHPRLFQKTSTTTLFSLPYHMIFAIATVDTIWLYTTTQLSPFACIKDVHYTTLTDLTWSPDGLSLLVSSSDGFCSSISFSRDEIPMTPI